MEQLAITIYELYQSAFSSVLGLLAPLGLAWSLVVISIVLGIILILIYGKISAQAKIALVKKQITANILESVLFRHDIGVSLAAQMRALGLSLRYAALAIPPLIILAIPCLLVLGQLYPSFGLISPAHNAELVVTAKLSDAQQGKDLTLQLTDSDSAPVAVEVPQLAEKSWRIDMSEGAQPKELILKNQNGEMRIPIIGKGGQENAGADSVSLAWLTGSIAVPAALSDSIQYVSLNYTDKDINWLGMSWNWIILFFIVSLIVGLIVSRFAKIEI